MWFQASDKMELISIGGKQYAVVNGYVELPDDLSGGDIKHLVEVHHMRRLLNEPDFRKTGPSLEFDKGYK